MYAHICDRNNYQTNNFYIDIEYRLINTHNMYKYLNSNFYDIYGDNYIYFACLFTMVQHSAFNIFIFL